MSKSLRSYQEKKGLINRESLKKLLILTCVVGLVIGLYILIRLMLLGSYVPLTDNDVISIIERRLEENRSDNTVIVESFEAEFKRSDKHLIIPKIGVDLGIFQGDESALNDGIWSRFIDREPEKEGNLVLTGHRFTLNVENGGFDVRSPLYNVEKLSLGDDIFVIWKDSYYRYKVEEMFWVEPNAVQIESNSNGEKLLTLYTCTLGGASDGRVVIIARQL